MYPFLSPALASGPSCPSDDFEDLSQGENYFTSVSLAFGVSRQLRSTLFGAPSCEGREGQGAACAGVGRLVALLWPAHCSPSCAFPSDELPRWPSRRLLRAATSSPHCSLP